MKVLITGASRGIGEAVALQLLKEGHEVIGTSRQLKKNIAGEENATDVIHKFKMLQLDLSDQQSIVECVRQAGEIDVLINNAGVSQMGAVEELPLEKIRELFETNFFGLIALTQAVLPQMRQRGKGFIINIGSLAGKFAVPFKSSYVASKFALAGFSWSLRNEVMPFGIKVTVLEPTDIFTSIKPELFTKPGSAYSESLSKVKKARDSSMKNSFGPEVVAQKVSTIIRKYSTGDEQPAPFYAVGKNGNLLVTAKRFVPDTMLEKMVKKSYGL